MSKFAGLLGRKAGAPADTAPSTGEAEQERDMLELDQDLFFPSANQLGSENETVRNLLADAECKLNELDVIKNAFSRLVEPVGKTLRAFEEERSEKVALQAILNNARVAYAKLHTEFSTVDKKAATLESECARLREELGTSQQQLHILEGVKAEQYTEISARRAQVADLQSRLQQTTAELQAAREEVRRVGERLAAADKRVAQLDTEADTIRQKFALSEKERIALQASLDHALNESARFSRRMVDLEQSLTAAQARLRQVEANFSDADSERTRLSVALEEVNERHLTELNMQRMRFDALQSRAATTEKLLEDARQTLLARAEEIRAYDRRLADSLHLRDVAEGKLAQIEATMAERENHRKEDEQARTTLTERNEALVKAVKTRDGVISRSQEKIQSLEDRILLLEAELRATKQGTEQQIEDLSAQLQREKLERAMAEGALETGRKDLARLLREISALKSSALSGDTSVTDILLGYRNAA